MSNPVEGRTNFLSQKSNFDTVGLQYFDCYSSSHNNSKVFSDNQRTIWKSKWNSPRFLL